MQRVLPEQRVPPVRADLAAQRVPRVLAEPQEVAVPQALPAAMEQMAPPVPLEIPALLVQRAVRQALPVLP